MKQFRYVLTQDARGSRRMGSLSRAAARFHSTVRLHSGNKDAALAEPHALQELDMRCGSQVTVTVEGTDEEAAVAAIQDYFVSNL